MSRIVLWCAGTVLLTGFASAGFMLGRADVDARQERQDLVALRSAKYRPSVQEVQALAKDFANSDPVLTLIQSQTYANDTIAGRRSRLEGIWKQVAPDAWKVLDENDRYLVTFYAVKYTEDWMIQKRYQISQLRPSGEK